MKICSHACRHHHPSHKGTPKPGASGVGDQYYPSLGNDGYNAQHYDIQLKVDPASNQVQGKSEMRAQATADLNQFNLDFHGTEVKKVSVNGLPALFRRKEDELIINPLLPLAQGEDFSVMVQYEGQPKAKDSLAGPFLVGWKNNGQGVVVDSQPDGAQTWFPVNDHPLDKATYSVQVEVPKPYVVAANGTLLQVEDKGETQNFKFSSRDPMASYLATVNIGNYVRDEQEGPNGIPIRNYYPPELAEKARFDFGRTPEMLGFFQKLFGPYPYENYGVIVVNDPKAVSGAMETQTLSLFEPAMVTGDRANEDVVAHELAHHWFGNLVSVAQWKDLVLHEGFATYCEWLWLEHTEGPEALAKKAGGVRKWLEKQEGITIGAPPPDNIFHSQVYVKGALALHELRLKVGDEAFFEATRSYIERHRGEGNSNVKMSDLRSIMEEKSGQSLEPFFQDWMYTATLPASLANPTA